MKTIKKYTYIADDAPYLKEQQDCIIAKHTCDYWLKELNIEQFSNLCRDYAIDKF